MALDTWLAFFLASWIISLSPGAGAIASMSSGLQYGFLRGYWNAIGLQIGLAMQIAVVAGGLGAILAASSNAFYAIKWFGVAYLVYLAVKQWRALPMDMTDDAAVRPIGKPMAMMFRGFLVNASNPKALVFMLAVLPQFVNPQAPLLGYIACNQLDMLSGNGTSCTPQTVRVDAGVYQLMARAFGGGTAVGGRSYINARRPGLQALFERLQLARRFHLRNPRAKSAVHT